MFYPLYQIQQHLSQSEHNDRIICTTYVHHGTNSGLKVNKNRPPQCRGEGTRPGQVTVLCSRARHFTLSVPLFN